MKPIPILKKIIVSLLIGATLGAFGFSKQRKARLDDLSWIIGAWKRETAKNLTIERWMRLSQRTIEGISHRIAKATGDTVFTEYLLLVENAKPQKTSQSNAGCG